MSTIIYALLKDVPFRADSLGNLFTANENFLGMGRKSFETARTIASECKGSLEIFDPKTKESFVPGTKSIPLLRNRHLPILRITTSKYTVGQAVLLMSGHLLSPDRLPLERKDLPKYLKYVEDHNPTLVVDFVIVSDEEIAFRVKPFTYKVTSLEKLENPEKFKDDVIYRLYNDYLINPTLKSFIAFCNQTKNAHQKHINKIKQINSLVAKHIHWAKGERRRFYNPDRFVVQKIHEHPSEGDFIECQGFLFHPAHTRLALKDSSPGDKLLVTR